MIKLRFKYSKTLLIITLLLASCWFTKVVDAVTPPPPAKEGVTLETMYLKAGDVLDYAYWLAFGLIVVYIAWGLVEWATAGGDDEKMLVARKKLLWGIVAAALMLGLRTLIDFTAGFIFPGAPEISSPTEAGDWWLNS